MDISKTTDSSKMDVSKMYTNEEVKVFSKYIFDIKKYYNDTYGPSKLHTLNKLRTSDAKKFTLKVSNVDRMKALLEEIYKDPLFGSNRKTAIENSSFIFSANMLKILFTKGLRHNKVSNYFEKYIEDEGLEEKEDDENVECKICNTDKTKGSWCGCSYCDDWWVCKACYEKNDVRGILECHENNHKSDRLIEKMIETDRRAISLEKKLEKSKKRKREEAFPREEYKRKSSQLDEEMENNKEYYKAKKRKIQEKYSKDLKEYADDYAEKIKKAREEAKETCKKEIFELRRINFDFVGKNGQLEGKNDYLNGQVDKFEKEIDDLKTEIFHLNRKNEELEKIIQGYKEKQTKQDEVLEENSKLNEKASILEKENKELEREHANLERDNTSIRNKMNSLQHQLETKSNEVVQLSSEVGKLRKNYQNISRICSVNQTEPMFGSEKI